MNWNGEYVATCPNCGCDMYRKEYESTYRCYGCKSCVHKDNL